jgi:putative transposase
MALLQLVCSCILYWSAIKNKMYRRERHSVTDLKIHLVCVAKYREEVFSEEELKLIEDVFHHVAKQMDFQILEINGEGKFCGGMIPPQILTYEHVHALIEYPPKLSVSKIVNALKGVSSRRYGQAGFRKPHGKTALWSPSYFAVSVGGAPIETLIQYIKEQSRPRRAGLASH